MNWYVAHDESGVIIQQGSCADDRDLQAQSEAFDGLIAPVNDRLNNLTAHYVHDGEVKPRPPMPATLDKTTIAADDTSHEVTGGSLTVTSPMQAPYKITCRAWPYLDGDYTLKAVEPEA
ncbi:MAG: hypothetical protein V6Z86_07420 [Hyphomicrobiales bacterium]